jgi:hypothetical protein
MSVVDELIEKDVEHAVEGITSAVFLFDKVELVH